MTEDTSCQSCKIISIGCLLGIGIYFIKLGLSNKPRYAYNIIATASICLGVGEIFDYSPFRNQNT